MTPTTLPPIPVEHPVREPKTRSGIDVVTQGWQSSAPQEHREDEPALPPYASTLLSRWKRQREPNGPPDAMTTLHTKPLPDIPSSNASENLSRRGASYMERYRSSQRKPTDLLLAIEHWERAYRSSSAAQQVSDRILHDLSDAYLIAYHARVTGLEAVKLCLHYSQLSLERSPPEGRCRSHRKIGHCYIQYYTKKRLISELDSAINHLNIALEGELEQDERQEALMELSRTLSIKYSRTMDRTHLDAAIHWLKVAVQEDPNKPWTLRNLGDLLHLLYKETKRLEALDNAIDYYQEAWSLYQAQREQNISKFHYRFGTALIRRHNIMERRAEGNPQDLERAIELMQLAVGSAEPRVLDEYQCILKGAVTRRNRTGRTRLLRAPTLDLSAENAISPQELHRLLERGKLRTLLIDVRHRRQVEEERIDHDATVWLDPDLLLEPTTETSAVEHALLQSSPIDQRLFENRSKFDLIVIYDQSSATIGDINSPLSILFRCMANDGSSQSPTKSLRLLIGGFAAWRRRRNADTHSPESSEHLANVKLQRWPTISSIAGVISSNLVSTTIPITPRYLKVLLTRQRLAVLLLDIRGQEHFEQERIEHDATICFDPVPISTSVNTFEIEDPQSISPSREIIDPKYCSKFDLVVIYGHDSATSGPETLSILSRWIVNHERYCPLKMPLRLLSGGIEAWKKELGKDGLLKETLPPHKEVEIPPNSRLAEPNEECIVCIDESDFFPLHPPTSTCTHKSQVCSSCLHHTIQEAVQSGIAFGRDDGHIRCPNSGCDRWMKYADIKTWAEPDVFEEYDRALLRHELVNDPHYIRCLNTKCNGSQLHDGAEDNPIVTCISCGAKQCFRHQAVWHEGYTCEQWDYERKAKVTRREDEELSKDFINRTTKVCPGPGCGRRITKTDGCDHFTCRKPGGCGFEFCWECLAPWAPIRTYDNSRHYTHCTYYRPAPTRETDHLHIPRPPSFIYAVERPPLLPEFRERRHFRSNEAVNNFFPEAPYVQPDVPSRRRHAHRRRRRLSPSPEREDNPFDLPNVIGPLGAHVDPILPPRPQPETRNRYARHWSPSPELPTVPLPEVPRLIRCNARVHFQTATPGRVDALHSANATEGTGTPISILSRISSVFRYAE